MALTTNDILLKKFQSTKFKEGYDQDEVDDFLDEVVVSMRELASENEDLKKKLNDAQARVAELTRELEQARVQGVSASPVALPVPVQPAPVSSISAESAAAESAANLQALRQSTDPAESATGMLALAQRLHDEYVRAGQEEGDRILSDARIHAAAIIREAEDNATRINTKLTEDQNVLERKIDELRIFERDYRTRMRSYLENLLTEIDGRKAGQSDSLAGR